jgi:hypothetical protein
VPQPAAFTQTATQLNLQPAQHSTIVGTRCGHRSETEKLHISLEKV